MKAIEFNMEDLKPRQKGKALKIARCFIGSRGDDGREFLGLSDDKNYPFIGVVN